MNTTKYLERIGLQNFDKVPNFENLKLLQTQHLVNIPFENLDIHWSRPIVLDIDKFYKKIVENKRGGFCYELNGLFNQLLNQIGYNTKIISARVSNGKGGFGEEYDHLAILTEINGDQILTDVGFGDFITEPLKFVLDSEQENSNGTYLIRRSGDEYFEVVKKDKNEWKSEYIFKNTERDLSEFAGMCEFHQSSKSHFSKGKVCSILTTNGRKTLTDKKYINNINGQKKESEINSDDEFIKILESEFGIRRNAPDPRATDAKRP